MLAELCRVIDDDHGGEDGIIQLLEGGATVAAIARAIHLPGIGRSPSRPFMYMWRAKGGETRLARWEQAMVDSAHALVEDGMEILDNCTQRDSAGVSLARSRAEYRRWTASRRNREAYGDKQTIDLNQTVDVGIAHLQALAQLGNPIAIAEHIPEAEVLDISDDDEE